MAEGDGGALRRLTQLFETGEVVRLDDESGEPLLVWVQKPNQFETEEARQDGRAAKARVRLVLDNPESNESLLVRADVGRMDKEQLVESIVELRSPEYHRLADNAIRGDAEWGKRLLIMERSEGDLSEEETEAVHQLNVDWVNDYTERVRLAGEDDRRKLADYEHAALAELYGEEYAKTRELGAFIRESQLTELYYAVRACLATWDEERARWVHERCDHSVRVFPDREAVRHADGELLNVIASAYNRLRIPLDAAKGSARRTSSSEPSRPPSEEEESQASTQTATSPEPDAT